MKKKTIEKIPYMTIRKCSREKGVKYLVASDIRDIKGEKHLLVEIYRNQEDGLEKPVKRLAMTKSEYAVFQPEKGIWTTKEEYEEYRDCTEFRSEADIKRIYRFCADKNEWWRVLKNRQEKIRRDRNYNAWKKKNDRRQEALKDRAENTPPLSEEKLLEYAEYSQFHCKHYLYYKKHGAFATVACSACGHVRDGRWKPGISLKSQYVTLDEPQAGKHGTCRICGAHGIYMQAGKAKGQHTERKHVFWGQGYKETGLVVRYIELRKDWYVELAAGNKDLELAEAGERLSFLEIARGYFEEGEKPQVDYHKYSYYSGKNFWDDCNLAGNANINIYEGDIVPDTYVEIKKSFLRYSALKEFRTAAGQVNAIEYLKNYIQTPQIEILAKLRLIGVVRRLLRSQCGIVRNSHAKTPDTFLGIRKERVRMLSREAGDVALLTVLQKEKLSGQVWTEEQLREIRELREGLDILRALKYMSVQKFLNRIEKYAGCTFGGCSRSQSILSDTAGTYLDYLAMRERLGYDLSNTIYLFPHDLKRAHDQMVLESEKEKIDKRVAEAEEKFPEIKKKYQELQEKYLYEDDKLLIRPASSAGEIVWEGRTLHHCVGGDGYLSKHARDLSYILFLRSRQEPDVPYVTVEISAHTEKILQWYGAYDRKVDKETIEAWLKRYVERLKDAEASTRKTA